MLFHLLDVTMINAYIIFCSSNKTKISHFDFMVDVIKGILEKSGTDMNFEISSTAIVMPVRLIGRDHFPEPTGKKRDCSLCSYRPLKRKQTAY